MQTLKRFFILGLFATLMLISSNVHAIYSPVISANVVQIQDHIISSQAQNGIGSLMEVSANIVNQYENKRAQGLPTGDSGKLQEAKKKIVGQAAIQSTRPLALYDSILMSFNILPSQGGGVISNCLRDDIWALEDLKDVVGEEMIKAYMLNDLFHGDLLSKDYDYLVQQIDILRRHGNNPNATLEEFRNADGQPMSVKEYLFGDETGVYYYDFAFPNEGGCPEGDFEQAFIRVANSAQTLATLSTGQGTAMNARPGAADWGNIWQMAQIRANQRAGQWFAANQISLTLGGNQGGQSQSLIKDNGWDQRMADMQTQIRILKNLAGPVTAPFSLDIYQNVDGVDIVGGEHNCVFFEPQTGTYLPCNTEQFEKFQQCNLTLKEAVDQNIGGIETNYDLRKWKQDLVNCGRFTSTQPNASLTEFWEKEAQRQEDSQLEYRNELLAFQYTVQFDDIGESAMNSTSIALANLENQIRRGVETDGNDEDGGLPTVEEQLVAAMMRHCPNKGYQRAQLNEEFESL